MWSNQEEFVEIVWRTDVDKCVPTDYELVRCSWDELALLWRDNATQNGQSANCYAHSHVVDTTMFLFEERCALAQNRAKS